MRSLILVSAVCAVVASMVGCSEPRTVNSEWRDLPSDGWRYGDIYRFNATGDTVPTDTLVLSLRHTSAYQYANVWLEVKYETADSVCADTVSMQLADEFGHWKGVGSGLSFQKTDTLIPSQRVRPGSAVQVRHIMRMDTLTEVQQIGVKFL